MHCVRDRYTVRTLPCSVLLKTPWSCSRGSLTLWGWHTTSWTVLMCRVPLMMLLMILKLIFISRGSWTLCSRCIPFIHLIPGWVNIDYKHV